MTTTERRVYAGITIAAAILALVGLGFVVTAYVINPYIGHAVDARMREARPIYTLECRPKE